MAVDSEELAEISFESCVIEWRGPAPFVFVPVPEAGCGEIAYAARIASYGWGCVPVVASIGATEFTTSLFPRDGGYLLPIKQAVQRAEKVFPGDEVAVRIIVRGRG